jgi:2-keto-4-pentenoate hydratase/2-oxohepta-3-ene-1,7-dioic acid hydratase in catechol pathway
VKFVRYGEKGKERPGVLDALDRIRDIGHLVPDICGGTLAQLRQFEKAIAGYCVVNDLSERAFQLERSGQWSKGKISQFMSLQPGDIVSTGTPPGVGLGQSPSVYLKPGQTMRVGIEKLGEQLQKTVAYDPRSRPFA